MKTLKITCLTLTVNLIIALILGIIFEKDGKMPTWMDWYDGIEISLFLLCYLLLFIKTGVLKPVWQELKQWINTK